MNVSSFILIFAKNRLFGETNTTFLDHVSYYLVYIVLSLDTSCHFVHEEIFIRKVDSPYITVPMKIVTNFYFIYQHDVL